LKTQKEKKAALEKQIADRKAKMDQRNQKVAKKAIRKTGDSKNYIF